jgi:hypothetical protein
MLTFSRELLELPPTAALRLIIEGPDGTLQYLAPSGAELSFSDESDKDEDAKKDKARLRWSLRARRGLRDLLQADCLARFRLACSFVLDKNGMPVSGAHLGGRLPTGDGVAGSDFESWFIVKHGEKAVSAAEVQS